MQVSKDKVVSFHYRLSDESGQEVESSYDQDANLFLVGHGNVLPALENAMMGHEKGEQFNAILSPIEAFGVPQEGQQQRIPAKYLKHEGKMKPGQSVRVNTNDGVKVGTVVKVGKFNVDVDMNHPLAGQTVTFAVEIIDIREASAEELAHGHAHGVGGHQHD